MSSTISNRYIYRWITNKPVRLTYEKTRMILFFLALNYLIVFIDITIAHAQDNFSPMYEWIPVIFCPIAAMGAIALLIKPKPGTTVTFHVWLNGLGVVIGILGFAFHINGVIEGSAFSLKNLVGGNPVFAPLALIALGSIGFVTVLDDKPNTKKYDMTQKTRRLLVITSFWFLATALVAFFDHAETNFYNIYTWFPIYMGIFAACITFFQAYTKVETGTSRLLAITMLFSIIVGLLGFYLHLSSDLSGGFSWSNVFYQAPGLAPLLFSDLGIWGLLVFLDPIENQEA